MIGTEIWRKVCKDASNDKDYWWFYEHLQHTPWIVNTPSEGLQRDLRDWCRKQYGAEYVRVWADKARQWQVGWHTCGNTWFGFHKREQLEAFCSAWDIEMPGESA